MTFRRQFHNPFCRALALALMLCCGGVRAQSVILHLRNGDRIAGVILSETPKELEISNVWSRDITVPIAQIEKREVVVVPLVISTNSPLVVLPAKPVVTNDIGKAMVIPPNTNFIVWLKRWKAEASVGMDLERGTVDHELYYGKAKLTYSQPYEGDAKQQFQNILNYDMEYGKTDGTLSDNRIGGSSKTDFDLSRRYYVYNLGAAFHDEIRLIDLHYEDGPGIGYHWFTQTNFLVNLELGVNYQVEDRSDGSETDSAYFRFGQDMSWKLNKQMTFTEKFEYFPKIGYLTQGRMRFESNLSYALILNLSLTFSVIDQYDTQPATTIPNNDLQIRTSLGVKF